MASKHMKSVQFHKSDGNASETTMRYHDTPNRVANPEEAGNTKSWHRDGAIGTLVHCWWECILVPPFLKNCWQTPHNPLLGLCEQKYFHMLTKIHVQECHSSFTPNSSKLETT